MPQIKPFGQSLEVSQRSVEDVSQKASRPGQSSANPPSTKQSFTVPLANATQVVGRCTVQIGNAAGDYGVAPGQVVTNAGGLPASIRLESPTPPPIPSTGVVPFENPVETPRVAVAGRTVNKTPPNLSVNLTERFINEAEGGKPLTPNLIARDGDQMESNARPQGPADKAVRGVNPIGPDPVIDPKPPTVVPPVVQPGYPGN